MNRNDKEYSKAYIYVIKLLSKRDYSKKRIKEKLYSKGYSSKTIDEILELLINENYINEDRTVRHMVEMRLKYKHWGPYKLRNNLYSKGYELSIINKVLSEIEDEDLLHCCENAIKDYLKHNTYSTLKSGKIYRFLRGRGFSNGLINRCLSNKARFYSNDQILKG